MSSKTAVATGVFSIGKPRERIILKSMDVKNFKSFQDLHLDLHKFNVIIGANASGKSNFTQIFKFLQDTHKCGLDDAISMQGGIEFVRNREIGTSEDLSIELHFVSKTQGLGSPVKVGKDYASCEAKESSYSIKIGSTRSKTGYFVKEETLKGKFEIRKVIERKKVLKKAEVLAEGEATLSRDEEGRMRGFLIPKKVSIKTEQIFPMLKLFNIMDERSRRTGSTRHQTRVFHMAIASPVFTGMSDFLNNLTIYDIDPKMSKKPTQITGRSELEHDGSNLAVVLRKIMSTKKSKRRMVSLLKDLLPFLEDLSISRLADSSLYAHQKESYGRKSLPATLISDGTINLIALVVALYFEREPFVIIEEPERNIHPSLISKLVEMIKEVSERMGKQIIVTTHNPEVVRHAGVKNLVLAFRNKKGFSEMSNPSDKKEVQEFLNADMGVEELYIQNLLED